MDSTSELTFILGKFLGWNKTRLDCFAKMLLALFTLPTVNLREIATAFDSGAAIDSRYKPHQTFLELLFLVIQWLSIVNLATAMFCFASGAASLAYQAAYLSLDDVTYEPGHLYFSPAIAVIVVPVIASLGTACFLSCCILNLRPFFGWDNYTGIQNLAKKVAEHHEADQTAPKTPAGLDF